MPAQADVERARKNKADRPWEPGVRSVLNRRTGLERALLEAGVVRFGAGLRRRVGGPGPTPDDLLDLEDEVERRFSRWLEQHGYLEEDDQDEEALDGWFGPAAYDTVQGHRPPAKPRDPNRFQVHARVHVEAGNRTGRERLCTYVARPPLAEAQIEPLDEDRVRLWLRNPGRSPASSVVLTSVQL